MEYFSILSKRVNKFVQLPRLEIVTSYDFRRPASYNAAAAIHWALIERRWLTAVTFAAATSRQAVIERRWLIAVTFAASTSHRAEIERRCLTDVAFQPLPAVEPWLRGDDWQLSRLQPLPAVEPWLRGDDCQLSRFSRYRSSSHDWLDMIDSCCRVSADLGRQVVIERCLTAVAFQPLPAVEPWLRWLTAVAFQPLPAVEPWLRGDDWQLSRFSRYRPSSMLGRRSSYSLIEQSCSTLLAYVSSAKTSILDSVAHIPVVMRLIFKMLFKRIEQRWPGSEYKVTYN